MPDAQCTRCLVCAYMRDGMAGSKHVFLKNGLKYFLREGWTGIRRARPSGKSVSGKIREDIAAQALSYLSPLWAGWRDASGGALRYSSHAIRSPHERQRHAGQIMRIAPGHRSAHPATFRSPHFPLTNCVQRSCCDACRLFRSCSSSVTRAAAAFMAWAAAL
jgi:hypothetical protein